MSPEALKHVYAAVDLLGTFVFAVSGAMQGVKHRLDLFGVLVLSFLAGNFGGILRDLTIGATPPPAVDDWRYLAVSVLAGTVVFYRFCAVDPLRGPLQLFDAAGLALFSVAGTTKAMLYGLAPVGAVLLGMLSGIGGGIARDALMSEVPFVFRSEIYAVAALAGSTFIVVGHGLGWPGPPTAAAGGLLCFGLRCIAIRRGWSLPLAGQA